MRRSGASEEQQDHQKRRGEDKSVPKITNAETLYFYSVLGATSAEILYFTVFWGPAHMGPREAPLWPQGYLELSEPCVFTCFQALHAQKPVLASEREARYFVIL